MGSAFGEGRQRAYPFAILRQCSHAALDQILARLRRAERRMRRQRHVGQFRQRMIRRQRLDVEDVEPGMADVAGLQRLDHRVPRRRCAPRAVLTRMTPGFIASMQARETKPRVSSFSSRCSEITSLSASRSSSSTNSTPWILLRRPVPGDHAHAAAERDARDFGGDAAKADQAERLAGELHAVVAQPVAGAHLAVHLGEAARRRPHQRDRAFGHRGVAIALDQVNLDAELGELFRIHVAARAGAEKHHVLQPGAFLRDLGRQRGVIDDGDLGAVEHFGILLRRDVGVAMDPHLGIAGLVQPLEDHRQRFIGIDKNSAHGNPPFLDSVIRTRRRRAPARYASARWRRPRNRLAWRLPARCG